MEPTWAEKMVLQSVGIRPEEATERQITLAGNALERCYYIDRAANELCAMLGGRAYWGKPR